LELKRTEEGRCRIDRSHKDKKDAAELTLHPAMMSSETGRPTNRRFGLMHVAGH
jgi:hypothetical protein